MGRRYQTEIHNDRGRQREYQGAYERDYNQHGTYIDGNTVRRYEAAPKPPPEKDPRHQIAALENQILELKTKNDAARNKIERSINLKQVRDIAINQMGMRYPTQDQIIYFEVDEDDYMNQYQDIPQG